MYDVQKWKRRLEGIAGLEYQVSDPVQRGGAADSLFPREIFPFFVVTIIIIILNAKGGRTM